MFDLYISQVGKPPPEEVKKELNFLREKKIELEL